MKDNLSSIVWSTTPDHAKSLLKMSPEAFSSSLQAAFHSSSNDFYSALAGETIATSTNETHDSGYVRSRDAIYFDPFLILRKVGDSLIKRFVEVQSSTSKDIPSFLTPPTIVETVGERATFPLKFQSANTYVGPRVALIGYVILFTILNSFSIFCIFFIFIFILISTLFFLYIVMQHIQYIHLQVKV